MSGTRNVTTILGYDITMRRTHRWHKSRTMMYPWNGRSRGDDDQGRLLEKGRRIYYLRFSCNSFLSISSVRNETGRSMLDRYLHDKRLSRLAVQVESPSGELARKFEKVRWVSRSGDLFSIFIGRGERYVETGIRLTRSTRHKGWASRWLRLVLFSSMTLPLTAFNARFDAITRSVQFSQARVYSAKI